MADISESDYGMGDYGVEFYSYKPIWLFESAVRIPFYVQAPLIAYGVRLFSATVSFKFDTRVPLGIIYAFGTVVNIPFHIVSNEYIGYPWISWTPDVPIDEPWIPDVPIGEPWILDIAAGSSWIADTVVSGSWNSSVPNTGPWIPIGPDTTPNSGW